MTRAGCFLWPKRASFSLPVLWIRKVAEKDPETCSRSHRQSQTFCGVFLTTTDRHWISFLLESLKKHQMTTRSSSVSTPYRGITLLAFELERGQELAMKADGPPRDQNKAESVCLTHGHGACPRLKDAVSSKSLTQIWSLILFSFLNTVLTLKSIPTVLTNADVKESSA